MTITYIAQPCDSRCQWWSALLPANIDVKYLVDKLPLTYLKNKADLELNDGQLLIVSEARHHRKNCGYLVTIGCAFEGHVHFFKPELAHKTYIKSKGHKDLMQGSGDIAAVIRIAIYLSRVDNLINEFEFLKNIN